MPKGFWISTTWALAALWVLTFAAALHSQREAALWKTKAAEQRASVATPTEATAAKMADPVARRGFVHEVVVPAGEEARCQRGVLMERVPNGWRAATYDDGGFIPCVREQDVCRDAAGRRVACR